MFKKFLSFIFSLILSFSSLFLFSCKKEDNVIDIYVVDGIPTLSVCRLFEFNEIWSNKNKYEIKVHVVNGVDAIKGAITRKEADLAVCPINLASAFYNGGVNYRLLYVNVLNTLHLVSNEVFYIRELRGKTVYNTGLGGTPDVAFKGILNKLQYKYTENLSIAESNKVNIKYVPTTADVVSLFSSNVATYALIPEPYFSDLNSIEFLVKSSYSLQELWDNYYDSSIMQAGVIVNEDFLYDDYEVVEGIASRLKDNVDFIRLNIDKVNELLSSNGSTFTISNEDFSGSRYGLTFLNSLLNKTKIETYLRVLYENSPSSIGGKLPNDDFYLDYEDLVKFQR